MTQGLIRGAITAQEMMNTKEADVGIATIAVAKLLGLPFIPIAKESFDMILEQKTFFHKGIQAFIETLK
jgi:molybdate-binding protein